MIPPLSRTESLAALKYAMPTQFALLIVILLKPTANRRTCIRDTNTHLVQEHRGFWVFRFPTGVSITLCLVW